MNMERNNGESSTTILEPIRLEPPREKIDIPNISTTRRGSSTTGRSLPSSTAEYTSDRHETLPSPTTVTEHVETWHSPRINIYRIFATFWSFTIMGANDAAYGPLIPYLENYYGLSYLVVSLIFLSPFVGYNIAAILNNTVHMNLGQRGVALLGPLCHLIAYVVIAVHPPYPVLVIVFILAGLGNGFEDSGWNAWIGAMANANEVLGFLHGFYGLGATIAPLIATSLITKAGVPWYYWYYFMACPPALTSTIGGATVELITSVHAFWRATGTVYREAHPRTSNAGGSRLKEATFKRSAAQVTWLSALFLLGYVGIEVALGGWIVTFMIRVRHGGAFGSGMVATGFWLGITFGRLILGFVTPRIGEKLAIAIYLPISIALELLFWFVPQFYVSAVAVSFVGFFLGPMFPAAMVACTKLLPKHLHVSGIGFSAAFGGSGGAIFPFAVGAIAQAKGVQVLQPIIVALLAVIWMLWLCLPRMNRKRD
ncbi:MFS general substrate transporter [Teratosphaeria nubilosa]|uniref:MFS general substrate transporter n=1 Tax=Teratosphaeria nubilosa TaxID=161662 RepID=A0A6G1KWK4_9PEZI|nr:MFS general substrate transporter [Teratosphaeria nubilosa]